MKNKLLTMLSALSIVSAIVGTILIAVFFYEQITTYGPTALHVFSKLF